MAISAAENERRTVRMTNPEWMPYTIGLCGATWLELGPELERVVLRHPKTWPHYQPGPHNWTDLKFGAIEDPDQGDFTDSWGCVWRTARKGFVGTVVGHPLEDLSKLEGYAWPDPATHTHLGPIDWEQTAARLRRQRADGQDAGGGLEHGFHLLRLEYLRGFTNLMCDLVEDRPAFRALVERVHAFNKAILTRYLDYGATSIGLPEDLGSQRGSLIGPALFRKWVLPYHRELHEMAHARGAITGFHCDGNIMDVADQILQIGPDIFNPQDLANGVEELARVFKGRTCIALDFDRQYHIPFGTRREIEALVEYEVKTLGSPRGGLRIQCEVRGPIPPENIDALASALEKWCTYWFE